MVRPAGMWKAVFAGILPNGEIFQTGFWFVANPPSDQAQADAVAVAVRTAFQGVPLEVMSSLIPPTAGFREIRVYHYENPTGGADAQAVAALVANGTGSPTNAHPLQVCLVTTLLTGVPGRRNRGRMYWPMLTEQLPNHQLTQARIDVISAAMATFFTNFNNQPALIAAIVMSQVGAGSYNEITAVSVDSEPDIQRRRANRQTELFQSSAAVEA